MSSGFQQKKSKQNKIRHTFIGRDLVCRCFLVFLEGRDESIKVYVFWSIFEFYEWKRLNGRICSLCLFQKVLIRERFIDIQNSLLFGLLSKGTYYSLRFWVYCWEELNFNRHDYPPNSAFFWYLDNIKSFGIVAKCSLYSKFAQKHQKISGNHLSWRNNKIRKSTQNSTKSKII